MTIIEQLSAEVGHRRGTEAADRLCELCVERFAVDAAAISLIFDGANTGTLGASGSSARRFDEVQFTLGEGPCLSSVADRAPVSVPDLNDDGQDRWPLYTSMMLELGVNAVYAMPVVLAGEYVGALDLFRRTAGPMAVDEMDGALAVALLAELPLLDLLDATVHTAAIDPDSSAWQELHALTRVEVSQATGVLVSQLDVEPTQALVRLRAHAYASGRSVTSVACDILDRRLRLEP